MSFRHSLLFIALTVAVAVPNPNNYIPSPLDAYPAVAPSLPITITLWVGGILLRVLAIWSLVNTRTVVSSTRAVLPPVLAIPMLSAAIMALAATTVMRLEGVLDWIAPTLTTGLSSLIAPILAALITYAIRARVPAGPVPEPT